MAVVFLGASALSGWAQEFANDATPTPPASGIRDKGGFLRRNPGAMERISNQLEKLKADHEFRIFLLVEPVLIGTSAPELAAQLQQSWLPEGDGIVVVFEADSRNLGFGRPVGIDPSTDGAAGRVPTHETDSILTKALEITDTNLAPDAYIEGLIGNLARESASYFQRRDAPPPQGRMLRMGLLTIGGVALLALGAIGIGALVRLPSMAGTRSFRFPAVDRPERLGAPGGGGNVTVRRFQPR